MNENEPLLEVDNVTIQYRTEGGRVSAVSDVSFTIEEADSFGLVGESGCGKSTIAQAVIGGLPDNGEVVSGSIRYKGQDISQLTDKELNKSIRWKEIALIPQNAMGSLDPLIRIDQQAAELANIHYGMGKQEATEKLAEMFDIVGIQPERISDYPHQFSGGMQQRAIIAFALFLEPSLIIADEPTTALDVLMQDQVMKYLESTQETTETGLLMITHDISVIFETCNKMAVMHSGQVAETGTVEDIFDHPRHPYSIMLQQAFPDIRFPNQELKVIEGSPPTMEEEVNYCTFVDRCPWAVEECSSHAPPLEQADTGSEGHYASCFRMDEVYQLSQQGAGQRTEDQHDQEAKYE